MDKLFNILSSHHFNIKLTLEQNRQMFLDIQSIKDNNKAKELT